MKLTDQQALARLVAHDHGALCTLHPVRGVDAVPVVYAVDEDGFVGVPIDLVKPKSSTRLQRQRNLEADPRATLLADRWDPDDWSQLWWVRASLRWQPGGAGRDEALADLLAGRHAPYRERPFAGVLVLRIVGLAGWSAEPTPADGTSGP